MEFTEKQLAAIQAGLEGFMKFINFLDENEIIHGYTDECIDSIQEVLRLFPDDE